MGNDVANPRPFSNVSARQARDSGALRDGADALGPLLAPVHVLRGVGPSLGATLGRLLGVPKCVEPRSPWRGR